MSNIIKSEGNDIVSILHNKSGGLTIKKPFEHNIFLFDSYIAGTSFVEGMEELAPYINIDDRLEFYREPDNLHDKNAIVIKNTNGVKIGYVPHNDNVIFSRLMDAGKLLFGKISNKEMKGTWLNISIKIYLHE